MNENNDQNADAAYYLSNYGSCALKECRCAQEGVWKGIMCPHWQSLGCRSHADLIAMARKLYGGNHVSR